MLKEGEARGPSDRQKVRKKVRQNQERQKQRKKDWDAVVLPSYHMATKRICWAGQLKQSILVEAVWQWD